MTALPRRRPGRPAGPLVTHYGRSLLQQATGGSSAYVEAQATQCRSCCSVTVTCHTSSGQVAGTFTSASMYSNGQCTSYNSIATLDVQCTNSFPSQCGQAGCTASFTVNNS